MRLNVAKVVMGIQGLSDEEVKEKRMIKDGCWEKWLVKVGVIIFIFHCSFLTAFAQTNKRTYDQFFMEAMVQRQKGNNDAAFDLLRHCQELNPDAPEVYFFLGQYYSLLKNPEKALRIINGPKASLSRSCLPYFAVWTNAAQNW